MRAVAQRYDTIVAAGGDGTINEVVNGVAGAHVNFGILPVGTMNVFATELGIPQNNLAKAWQVIEDRLYPSGRSSQSQPGILRATCRSRPRC